MRDAISEKRIELLHPEVRQEAKEAIEAAEAGFPANMAIRIAQGLRTIKEQNGLYAIGRTKPGKKVTNARGGKSFHNYGLAVDFCLLIDKDGNGTWDEVSWDIARDFDKDGIIDWHEVVIQFELRGWSWGGKWRTFKDYPHVEKSFGYKVSQLEALYNSGKRNGEYVIINNN